MLISDADGWVKLQISSVTTHFKIFAETPSAGSVYVLLVKA
jgi:hypothetical protein